MAEIKIELSSIELNVDETATIYTFDSPRTYLFQSTPELIEAGVSVQTYGVITVPTDATLTGNEVVEVEYVNKTYSALLSSIISAEEGDEISFSSLFITLEDLADVAITEVTDGQALVYDSATAKWVNGDVSSGGGGESAGYEGNFCSLLIDETEETIDSVTVEVSGGEGEFTDNCNFTTLDMMINTRGVVKLSINGNDYYGMIGTYSEYYDGYCYNITLKPYAVFVDSYGEPISSNSVELYITMGATSEYNYIGFYSEDFEELESVTLSFTGSTDVIADNFFARAVQNSFNKIYYKTDAQHDGQYTSPAIAKYYTGSYETLTFDQLKNLVCNQKPTMIYGLDASNNAHFAGFSIGQYVDESENTISAGFMLAYKKGATADLEAFHIGYYSANQQ